MPLHHIDTAHPALKTGYAEFGDSSACIYAVFPTELVTRLAKEEEDPEETAMTLTGWHPYYRGVGKSFAEVPYMKTFGKKTIVKQWVGKDI